MKCFITRITTVVIYVIKHFRLSIIVTIYYYYIDNLNGSPISPGNLSDIYLERLSIRDKLSLAIEQSHFNNNI